MSEEKEKYVEPIRSKLFMDILKIVKKLNLVKTDKDDYDHLSVTYELEKLYNKLEQQKAELLEKIKGLFSRSGNDKYDDGYDKAISDVLDIFLKQEERDEL